jgi:hypothetical protein
MKLEEDTNYIVSGLERSGTSMLMQILCAGDLPCAFDESRKPDDNNPKGYYELEGGKIINKLMNGSFPLDKFKGKIIKITAYGLKFLPPGKYKIIYTERNIEEILDSMEKMARIKDENREETRQAFIGLNNNIKKQIQERNDIDYLFINYNEVLSNPEKGIKKIHYYLEMPKDTIEKMIDVVDKNLYRNRKNE